jgi:hypothetical protein
MTTRRCAAIASAAVATSAAVALVAAGHAGTTQERPRGVVEDCSRISGFGESRRDFTLRRNLVVGPVAIHHAGQVLPYSYAAGGNKLFVVVKGGHRVTLELSRETRRDAGLVFGRFPSADVRPGDARRVVRFVACRRDENPNRRPTGWPVSGWVGFLLARSPQCVPLRIWVDDDPAPRRAVIRFGVRHCG